MTLREAYAALGGDYSAAKIRLINETLMLKYLGMFPADDSFPKLKEAFEAGGVLMEQGSALMAEEKYREAFEASHALKGVAANLGMDDLAVSSGALCEALRYGYTVEADELYVKAEKDYDHALEIIRNIG